MLDEQGQGLLSPDRLRHLFSEEHRDIGFISSLRAIKNIRNKLMHGEWRAWDVPWWQVTEVTLKLVFALCTVVEADDIA